jgi:2-polyprenyl-3-methyl-5-hydroxy-6-metoxy-1,4-benzoquinol methylase
MLPFAQQRSRVRHPAAESIRVGYEAHGTRRYYEKFGGDYRNPHEPVIRRSLERVAREWELDLSNVLDLAAGSGEVTLALRELGASAIHGIDPHTSEAYAQRTGHPAERLTFEQIAAGALEGRCFSLIACSFAMHLCEPSRLPALLLQLARCGTTLLVLTPHKRPDIREAWGWRLEHELLIERVRSRLYASMI